MDSFLFLIPGLPLAGFFALALSGSRLKKVPAALIGVAPVLASAVLSTVVSVAYLQSPPQGGAYIQGLWRWVSTGNLKAGVSLYFDSLALVMVLVVTWVGFLILLYSTEFMSGEEGYARFFAYMDLFVASMLLLVMAGDLIPLYAGWEGVGLCSYLLIGFWYEDPANGWAARKAFIVTRVGDTAMAIGLFVLFTQLGTLNIQELMHKAVSQWTVGAPVAALIAGLMLTAAVAKSAQLPLQVWLPDAMAGPSPVSALIHAATMVTAGVYLIARTSALFTLAPRVQGLVAVIGVLTLLLASFSALVQRDIKRVLAYSTISQIGYMFLALGVGAYSAAMFHFTTHAFFKALLFLSAGVVIQALGHERDIFRMGGLRREVPVAFWTFLAGAASLSALPFITAGFYSKDLILLDAYSSTKGGIWLWSGGVAGALLTAMYTFRLVFITFFGEAKTPVRKKPGGLVQGPLIVLAGLAVLGGLIDVPRIIAHQNGLFPHFLSAGITGTSDLILKAAGFTAPLAGIVLAYMFYFRPRYKEPRSPGYRLLASFGRFWSGGWGFDRLYDTIFVRPFSWISRINRGDFFDLIFDGAAWYSEALNSAFVRTQSGRIRHYAFGIVLGAIVTIGIVLFI